MDIDGARGVCERARPRELPAHRGHHHGRRHSIGSQGYVQCVRVYLSTSVRARETACTSWTCWDIDASTSLCACACWRACTPTNLRARRGHHDGHRRSKRGSRFPRRLSDTCMPATTAADTMDVATMDVDATRAAAADYSVDISAYACACWRACTAAWTSWTSWWALTFRRHGVHVRVCERTQVREIAAKTACVDVMVDSTMDIDATCATSVCCMRKLRGHLTWFIMGIDATACS